MIFTQAEKWSVIVTSLMYGVKHPAVGLYSGVKSTLIEQVACIYNEPYLYIWRVSWNCSVFQLLMNVTTRTIGRSH